MTKWGKLVIVSLMLILGTSTMVYGKKDNGLSSTKKMMRGHIVALYLNQILHYPSIFISFNEKESAIELEMSGGYDDTIDQAKAFIGEFRRDHLTRALERLNKQFGLTLSEQDITITYMSNYSNEILIVFKDGNYTLN